MERIDYATPGEFTDLSRVPAATLDGVDGDPVEICRPVRGLVTHPFEIEPLRLPAERMASNQTRPADRLIDALMELDPAPLAVAREPVDRIVGTCRHFAVLGCALLRHRGVSARVRCGFATYFRPGRAVDHWVIEYREPSPARWVRLDAQILGGGVLDHAEDLRRGEFLSGGEAWQAYRRDEIDASIFGVDGTDNWGPAEIRGNAVRDLAALNKVETLPWDEWGRMSDAYAGTTGSDYDERLDELAEACARDDPVAVAATYAHPDFAVPAELLH